MPEDIKKEMLEPGDIKSKAEFWMSVENGELPRSIAYYLRCESNSKQVILKAIDRLYMFINKMNVVDNKPYRATRKDIESFTKKFEKYYTEFHYLEKISNFIKKFKDEKINEPMFDKMNEYLWSEMFIVNEKNICSIFKQWMVNEKRMLKGIKVDYPILFGLWSPTGGNGKSFLLESLAKALSDNHLFVLSQWADLETTSGSYLKDVFGVLYKDEIGTTKGYKDTIKSLITASEVTIQCKYKEPIKLPKRFQLLCSANKPIGPRLFEDESGYQRRDGTCECWGRLIDVKEQLDLIKFFSYMYLFCPTEYKMSSMTSREFEYDEDTLDMLRKISQSCIKSKTIGNSRDIITMSFSKICSCDVANIDVKQKDTRYYKLEALLEKSGCFTLIKYSNVSTRYFRPNVSVIKNVLESTVPEKSREFSISKFSKPSKTKDFKQIWDEIRSKDYRLKDNRPSFVNEPELSDIDAIINFESKDAPIQHIYNTQPISGCESILDL